MASLSGVNGLAAGLYAVEPPAAAPVYRISGVVLSSRDGSPIAQCRVSVTEAGRANSQTTRTDLALSGAAGRARPDRDAGAGQRQSGSEGARAQESEPVVTDRQGRFSIAVPKAGVWRLTGRARGYRAQSYDQHEQFWSGVVLTAAAPEFTLTLRLTPDASITGTIFDEAGEAVRNAQVSVVPVRTPGPNEGLRGGGATRNATTDDRGRYEVSGLQPGKYRVRVTAQPWYATALARSPASPDPSLDMVYPETWYPAASDERSADPITLNGGEERQADFHLTPMPSIHLRIPLPGQSARPEDGEDQLRGMRAPIVARVENGGGRVYPTAITFADGKEWDIGGLTPGNYDIRVATGDGPAQKLSQVIIASGSPALVGLGSATVATKLTITIDGVEDSDVRQVTLVDVTSRQSFRTNMRQDRRGPDDDEDNEPSGVRTVTAPPGRYEVYLNGSRGLYLAGLTATGAKVAGRTLELSGGSPKLVIHATIGEGEVDGIARRDGKPASGAMVLLVPAAYGKLENVAPVERDETNTDGSFTLANVIPGEYILVAIDHGWEINWRDNTTLSQYLASGTPINVRGSATIRKEIEATAP